MALQVLGPDRGAHAHPLAAPRTPAPPSLLHGLALQLLRSDWDLTNIHEHDQTQLPPWVRKQLLAAAHEMRMQQADAEGQILLLLLLLLPPCAHDRQEGLRQLPPAAQSA